MKLGEYTVSTFEHTETIEALLTLRRQVANSDALWVLVKSDIYDRIRYYEDYVRTILFPLMPAKQYNTLGFDRYYLKWSVISHKSPFSHVFLKENEKGELVETSSLLPEIITHIIAFYKALAHPRHYEWISSEKIELISHLQYRANLQYYDSDNFVRFKEIPKLDLQLKKTKLTPMKSKFQYTIK